MEHKKISVVIPNYNGVNLLERNLPKVMASTNAYNSEIIIVDDASTDGSIFFLSKFFPKIKIISHKTNRGFSATVNTGVTQSTGEIIVLLNHDVYPDNFFLNPLLKHFNHSSVFGVGCLQRSLEKNSCELRGRGIGGFSRGLLVHQRGNIYTDNNSLWVSGGAGAFKKSLWLELGGLDELYDPFYWEDIDICYRAIKAGYKIFFEKESIVYHDHSEGAIMKSYNAQTIKKITFRNQFIFFWKNITSSSLWVSHLLWLPYLHIRFLLAGDASFLVGFIYAVGLFFSISKHRDKVQKYWILQDELIVRPFKKETSYA